MIHVRCDRCGEVYPANQDHKCAKASKAEPAKKRVVTKKAVVTPKKPVTTQAVTTGSDRVKAWRAANREHYNATMRDYRAKVRAQKAKETK